MAKEVVAKEQGVPLIRLMSLADMDICPPQARWFGEERLRPVGFVPKTPRRNVILVNLYALDESRGSQRNPGLMQGGDCDVDVDDVLGAERRDCG